MPSSTFVRLYYLSLEPYFQRFFCFTFNKINHQQNQQIQPDSQCLPANPLGHEQRSGPTHFPPFKQGSLQIAMDEENLKSLLMS